MMKMNIWQKRFVSVSLAFILAGCAVPQESKEAAMPDRYSLPSVKEEKIQPEEGSLFSDNSPDLYQDSRARNVGDILMVEIVEKSSGKKKAETTTERESEVTAGISSFFGFETWLANKNSNFIPSDHSLSAKMVNDFEGTGETNRDDTLVATISARVIDKTMDGNLVIRGYREIRVNNETQFIILSGIVRPRDVTANNTIQSSKIAEARIEYSGTGIISEKQQPGWFARGLDVVWPF